MWNLNGMTGGYKIKGANSMVACIRDLFWCYSGAILVLLGSWFGRMLVHSDSMYKDRKCENTKPGSHRFLVTLPSTARVSFAIKFNPSFEMREQFQQRPP